MDAWPGLEEEALSLDNTALPDVPKDKQVGEDIARLAYLVFLANAQNDGVFSLCIYRGKWFEVTFWDGVKNRFAVEKDTRITESSVQEAIRYMNQIIKT